MIDHNLKQLELNENYEGEQVLPFEKGNVNFPSTLRQFIVQAHRAYSQLALEGSSEVTGLKLQNNNTTGEDSPFFHLKLIVKPEGSIADFVSENGNNFFNQVLSIIGYSDIRGNRGNRGAFLGEFKKEKHAEYGEVLSSNILISTTVFYNDYRATSNYPYGSGEFVDTVGDIYEKITRLFPDLAVEINYNTLHEEVEDNVFDLKLWR